MNCQKCNSELFIDHVDKDGRYFYTCLNRQCEDFRKAFNPMSGTTVEAHITAPESTPVEEA